jgi:hypothetical protein
VGENLERKKRERKIDYRKISVEKRRTHTRIDRAVNCPFTFNQGHYLCVGNQAKDVD